MLLKRLARNIGKKNFEISESLKSRIAPHDLERYATENLILVDENDKEIGSDNILKCHLTPQPNTPHLLHRAFSVCLFDTEHNLLLQRRAMSKALFPGYWSNTCCSHPLKNIEGEDDVYNYLGVRRAASRRVKQELRINIEPQNLIHAGILHYTSKFDDDFTECEMDHILLGIVDGVKPQVSFNPKEVDEYKWVDHEHFHSEMQKLKMQGKKLCPWFEHIITIWLNEWWNVLEDSNSVRPLMSGSNCRIVRR